MEEDDDAALMQDKKATVKFIALLSILAGHYHWPHDFWRRMGRREFYAWVDQLGEEEKQRAAGGDSWEAAESDPGWQKMRDKRERARGR